MTNLQAGALAGGSIKPQFTRERVLIGAPILVGGLAALGVLVVATWPAWLKLQQSEQQWRSLQDQAVQLPLLRSQLQQTEARQAKAEISQARILNLIAGSGDISTFMAQLGAEAIRSGVQLDSYEPVEPTAPAASAPPPAAPPPAGAAKTGTPVPAAAPEDPLCRRSLNLRPTSRLISAKAPTPQLLNFLRRLERLSLLVVQRDLSLKRPIAPVPKPGAPLVPGSTELRLNLTLCSRAPAG
jgi:type IV pilus assembly protein PilO